jgi:hypothetical protein
MITPLDPTPMNVAEEAVFSNQALTHDSIAYFQRMTDKNNPLIHKVMGEDLENKLSVEDFSAFCKAFARGLEYVRDRYGVQPSAISITPESRCGTYTNLETNIVVITPDFIERSLKDTRWAAQANTNPFILSVEDMAMMNGVEQALIVYQNIRNPEQATTLAEEQQHKNAAQDDQSLTSERKQAIHQAMIDLGVVERSALSPRNIHPDQVAWAIPELKQRTIPPSATITEAQPTVQRVAEAGAAKGL